MQVSTMIIKNKENQMKHLTVFVLIVMALSVAGCAKKTASEQLRDDMKKAAKDMDRELKSL